MTARTTPSPFVQFQGATVTLDDRSAPRTTASGPLAQPGWRRPADALAVDATDNDWDQGRPARDRGPDDHQPGLRPATITRPAPCSDVGERGWVHRRRYSRWDRTRCGRQPWMPPATRPCASARSASTARRRLRCSSARAEARSCSRSRTTPLGVAGATLEVRRQLDRALPDAQRRRCRSASCAPMLDRGSASRVDMRVTVRDNAGNVTQGNPTRLSATSAKVGRRFRRVRSGRVKLPFGRRATLRGRLTLSAGQAYAGQTIVATSTVRSSGAERESGRQRGDRPPRPLLARGPRRPEPRPTALCSPDPAARSARPGTSPSACPRRARSAPPAHAWPTGASASPAVYATAASGSRAAGLCSSSKGRERGKWRTFEDTRTEPQGSLARLYTFSGRPGRYPIRVRIRHQSGYPFELGYSRALTIRVG